MPFRLPGPDAGRALQAMWNQATQGDTSVDGVWTADGAVHLMQVKWVSDADRGQAVDQAAIPVVVLHAHVHEAMEQRRWQVRLAVLSSQWLTSVAVFLAGRQHAGLGDEWRSHLHGVGQSGISRRTRARDALGFVVAAVRYRVRDACDLAWRPVDAVLGSRDLSNLVVLVPTLYAALAAIRHDGAYGLVSNAEGLIAIGGFLYGLVHVGRRWRGVKPPRHKARRPKR